MFTNQTLGNEKPASEFKSQLTKSQKEVLDSYIGSEGIYILTIRENEDINSGTKLLYLEKAINEKPKDFLKSLKILCLAPEKESTIELVRALKVINDLYHNNKVAYGIYGSRNALDHYFHGLGKIDLSEIQSHVREAINLEIASLRSEAKDDIADQMTRRKNTEWNMVCNDNLTNLLNLTFYQQVPCLNPYGDNAEIIQKRDLLNKFLSKLHQAGIIDLNDDFFKTSFPLFIFRHLISSFYELSWSDIPFTKENVGRICSIFKIGATHIIGSLAGDISILSEYGLDNQANFDTITDIGICAHTPDIMIILVSIEQLRVPISQINFDKIIANYPQSHSLANICQRITNMPGGMTQKEFDMLIQLSKFSDDIYKKLVETGKDPMDRETFVTIMENIRNEKTGPVLSTNLVFSKVRANMSF